MSKGISSLIATVILLGATIVLASILFTWTSDLFKEDNSKSTCKLELERLCVGSSIGILDASVNATGAIYVLMENNGNYAVKSVRVTSFLSNSTIYSSLINFSVPLPPFYPINFTLNYLVLDLNNPPINPPIYSSIEISPIISTDFESETCETICNYKATRTF